MLVVHQELSKEVNKGELTIDSYIKHILNHPSITKPTKSSWRTSFAEMSMKESRWVEAPEWSYLSQQIWYQCIGGTLGKLSVEF